MGVLCQKGKDWINATGGTKGKTEDSEEKGNGPRTGSFTIKTTRLRESGKKLGVGGYPRKNFGRLICNPCCGGEKKRNGKKKRKRNENSKKPSQNQVTLQESRGAMHKMTLKSSVAAKGLASPHKALGSRLLQHQTKPKGRGERKEKRYTLGIENAGRKSKGRNELVVPLRLDVHPYLLTKERGAQHIGKEISQKVRGQARLKE